MSAPEASPTGNLTLGNIFSTAGVMDLDSVVVMRHTWNPDGLRGPEDVTPERVLDCTRTQLTTFPYQEKPLWLVFITDGGLRSRFFAAYVNHGESLGERTGRLSYFNLEESSLLASLKNRLVIKWAQDAINWARPGPVATRFPVIEIADREAIPFPGFDRLLIHFETLKSVVEDSRYAPWRTALAAVQGIYLITDTTTGKHYVGKADGTERFLGRWRVYARTGHGENVKMKELVKANPDYARHFIFSILRVFGPSTPSDDVTRAEAHYKEALRSIEFGLNAG